jgi:GxxExxY protein
MEIHELSKKIIGCAFKVQNLLGYGFLEKVYENALVVELREYEGLSVKQQHPAPVFSRDRVIGEYIADLFVDNLIIVEVKSVSQLLIEHESRLVNYLKAANIDHGLLINFGPSVEVKHKNKGNCSPRLR